MNNENTPDKKCGYGGVMCGNNCYALILIGIVNSDVKNEEDRIKQVEYFTNDAREKGCTQV